MVFIHGSEFCLYANSTSAILKLDLAAVLTSDKSNFKDRNAQFKVECYSAVSIKDTLEEG